jgi:hypothetical protein
MRIEVMLRYTSIALLVTVICLSTVSWAQPISGTYTGIVTSASDPLQSAFGRDPAEWIGQTITGTFVFDSSVPGVGDRDPDPENWTLGPVPGPGPFIEFVTLTAEIDGQSFETSSAELGTIFFGDVVGIHDQGAFHWFAPQDSYVGSGRSVIGFDAYFQSGGVQFDGVSLSLDPALLAFGHGVVEDLASDPFGNTIRHGLIHFQLTNVTLSIPNAAEQIAELVSMVVELNLSRGLSVALDRKLQNAMDALDRASAGDSPAAIGMLHAFTQNVRAQSGRAISQAQAAQLIAAAQAIIATLEAD